MAIKDYINASYLLEGNDELLVHTTNYFDVMINPTIDIGFTWARCSLYYQIKGKLTDELYETSSIIIDRNNYWEKGSKNIYKGRFELEDVPISYHGENIQIIWFLNLEVKLDIDSKSTIQKLLFEDRSMVNPFKSFDGKYQNKNLVIVNNSNYLYEINSFEQVYKIDPYIYLIIGVFILIITSIFFFGEILKKYLWIPTIAGIGITGYGIYKVNSIGLLKEIKFKGTPLDVKSFNLELTIKKNQSKITSATIYYSVIEEVIDDRGTSSTTYTESIYTSERKTIKAPFGKVLATQLSYPSKDLPIDFSRRNVRFFTQIEVSFHFKNNTKGKIKQEFPLYKIA